MINTPSLELVKPNTPAQQGSVSATQTAPQESASLFETAKTEITSWLNDTDKICEDGQDDGELSLKEKAEYFGKGLLGIIKTAAKHPIMTGATIAGGALLTVATGGAALPVLVGVGATLGAGTIAYGGYKASTAETDAEAKQAWETIGNGTFGLAASMAGAGAALKAGANGGVAACQGATTNNPVTNTLNCIKATPQALAQSAANIKGNFLTATTGILHANSNALRAGSRGNEFMSKANEVQAYRFNPNGTPDEVLANNPNVFMGDDGNYYLPNKWNPNEPYLIDTSKEQMIMMYGPDDMAVCDGKVFNSSYVDTGAFKGTGTRNYQNPADLPYGEVIDVTKQAAGSYMVAPEGTKVQSLEGVATVNKGDVIAIDSLGNPYTQPAVQTMTKNNINYQQQVDLLKTMGIEYVKNTDIDKYLGIDSLYTYNGEEFTVNTPCFNNPTDLLSGNIKNVLKGLQNGQRYFSIDVK